MPADLVVTFSASAVSGAGALLEIAGGDNQTAAVGSALPDSLVVRVTDALGNPAAGVQVDWTVTGGGSISPTSTLTDADGLAAAERVLGNASGAQQAQAASAGLASVGFSHTAQAANPTALVLVSGNGQSGAVGTALAEPLVVRLEDDNGNGVGGKPITWLVATGGGSVNPMTATTSPNGLATTTWTLGPNTISNTLNAVFSGVPSVPFTANAQAGAAAKLAFSQAPVTTSAGATITPAVKVAVQDGAGNTVVSATDAVTLAIGANPGGGTLSGTVTVNAVNGVATFPGLSIDKSGNGYTLVAASGSLAGATSTTFDILTGNANRLVFIVGPTDRTVGQKFSPALQVQVQDAGGNPVTTATTPITLTSSVTGTLTGTSVATPFLGTATFSNLAINKAGADYTLTALSSGVASGTSDPFQVIQAGTTIAITSRSPNASVPGQNVTVTYDVNISAPGAGSLTGSVTVTDGPTSCTGGINAGSGIGSCALAFPTAGTRNLTATYSGDANFLTSASSPQSHTVNKASTTLNITADAPDFSVIGNAVPVQWTLGSAGSAPLTGTVTLTVVGGSETCSAAASLGSGSCNLTFEDNGGRTITATYSGDSNYNGSTDNEPHAVRGSTSTTLGSSANPSTAGQNVTFTAHVTAISGSGNPTGQVRILDGASIIGQANLNGAGDVAITVSLALGTHTITAAYQGSGASFFDVSTSAPLTQQVDAPANVPPSATDDGFTVLEDQTLNVSPGNGVLKNDSDPDSGPQALTATNASDPAGGAVTLAANGSFTYTPDPDFNGSDPFTYQAFDGAASSPTATVTITVTPVNDAPSFTSGGDVTASASGGAVSQAWAADGSPGPANESAQTLTYDAEIGGADALFFSSAPAIEPDGKLTFTPSGLPGQVTVTVRLHDSGGTANGGSDTSPDQTFTITLDP